MTPRKYIWRITWSQWGTKELTRYLLEGWEPFGATTEHIWLRKRKTVAS